jgi:hypothetical protein
MCMGRISKKWSAVAIQYTKESDIEHDEYWASIIIRACWQYAKAVWKFRNEVMHGATVQDRADRLIATLQTKVRDFYAAYRENPQIVLSRHQYLFTSRPLEERLNGSYDITASWIRSVEEAILVLKHHKAAMHAEARSHFDPYHTTTSTDSDYSPHSDTASIMTWSDSSIASQSTSTLTDSDTANTPYTHSDPRPLSPMSSTTLTGHSTTAQLSTTTNTSWDRS